jgi:hypothetical protein
MPPEVLKLLVDIKTALADIKDFTIGMDFATVSFMATTTWMTQLFGILSPENCQC